MCKSVMLFVTYLVLLRVKTFEKDLICWYFSLDRNFCTFDPPLLLSRHRSFFISYYISSLSQAKQTLSLSSAAQTKRCTDVRSQICTMTPFQGATVGTLKTITPLSSLWGVITESDAPAEFVEIRMGRGCSSIVYRGRWANRRCQLRKDAGRTTWEWL